MAKRKEENSDKKESDRSLAKKKKSGQEENFSAKKTTAEKLQTRNPRGECGGKWARPFGKTGGGGRDSLVYLAKEGAREAINGQAHHRKNGKEDRVVVNVSTH